MANMTDRNRVQWLLQALFTASATATFTPGTGGGSALVLTPPYKLRLMSANGSPINTANGTELTTFGGYTAGGASMGSSAFGAPTAGVAANSNLVTWNCDQHLVDGGRHRDLGQRRHPAPLVARQHHQHHRGRQRGHCELRRRVDLCGLFASGDQPCDGS